MRILAHPIDVVFLTSKDGTITPLKFRYEHPEKGTENTYNIDAVLDTKDNNMAGEKSRIFTCECVVGEKKVLFELKYALQSAKWVLYRIVGK